MRSNYGNEYARLTTITSAKDLHEAMRAKCNGGIRVGAARGLLALVLLASMTFVALGGAIAVEQGPISEPAIAVVAVQPADFGLAPHIDTASTNSKQFADYFPCAYPQRGDYGDDYVMTFEHD